MKPAYTYLAQLYDYLMDEDYDKWCAYLVSLFAKYEVMPKNILDLGCGTGNLSIPLAKRGFTVTGVDISPEMIHLAQQKPDVHQLPLTFYVQDMRSLCLELHSFDVVISACDALNYLRDAHSLSQAFTTVSSHLKPNGLFLCDFNTEYKLREIYGDLSYADLEDEFAYFWDNHYNPEQRECHMELTFFLQNLKGMYTKVSESHVQKAWAPQEIQDLALEAGLKQLGCFCFPTELGPDDTCERWQFIFRKIG